MPEHAKITFLGGDHKIVDGDAATVASKVEREKPTRLTITRDGEVTVLFVNWGNVLYIESVLSPSAPR